MADAVPSDCMETSENAREEKSGDDKVTIPDRTKKQNKTRTQFCVSLLSP